MLSKLKNLLQWGPRTQSATKEKTKDNAPKHEPIVAKTEPWPKPVDGAALLDNLSATFKRFLVLPDGAAEALALWVLHTHCFEAVYYTPYLNINSPEKGCGKTTNLEILGQVVAKPLFSSNITAPAVFRTVEKYHPTLLIDEADTFLSLKEELRGVLNSGNRKNSAYVIRLVGDSYDPKPFSTWCPKAFALIGRLPDTLEDRSIVVTMYRKTKEEKVEDFNPYKMAPELKTLQRKCARWAKDNLDALREADPQIPGELHNRTRDKWKPLLAIAEVAGGVWPELTRTAALSLSVGLDDSEDSIGIQLLADIGSVFDQKQEGQLSSATIESELNRMRHRPWAEYKNGYPISQHQIARLLSPYKIKPKQLWVDGAKTRGYERAAFEDAFSRYLPEAVGAVEPSGSKGLSLVSESVGSTDPTTSEKGANPHEQCILPDLPSGQGVDSDAE